MNKNKILRYRDFYKDYLLNDVVPFWERSDLIDREYGGFITSVDRYGRSYNNDKSVWFQGRCLWTFSKLCNSYGKKELWLKAAESGAEFIKKHCIDGDGRLFFTVTREGLPLRKRRYFFSESFLVVGFAEYYLQTKDPNDLYIAEKYFDFMYSIYKDPSADPFKITPKENTSVRDLRSNAYPMVLISSAQTLMRISGKKDRYDRIIREIVNDMLGLHYKEDLKCVLENVPKDGGISDTHAGRTINPGHSIENSWFLMNYASTVGDKELLKKALNILDWSIEKGWDKEYGGIYYFTDAFDKPCEQLEYDMKLWWVHNECLIATILAYKLTGDEKYFKLFEKTHEYAFSHFADRKYGEWYGYLHRDGSVSHTQKGSMWKGPYHLPRCLILCENILSSLFSGDAPELL
ncbi:MAG: AGE family epimerase/isomerase [Clostridia bacterium]|nr:AGE family epimerase/isomerase [Clostridia bacterium]